MENFVNIVTATSTSANRTVEYLAAIYQNPEKLKALIKNASGKWLNKDIVADKRILIKPNWVKHNSRTDDEICLRTNEQFLLATIEYLMEFKPKSIVLGDAPIQSCHWNKMISPVFVNKIDDLAKKYLVDIIIKDFRRVTFDPKNNNLAVERNPIEDYLIFDVGNESLLEPISKVGKNRFRVTYYNPDRIANVHRSGVHKYCITKELFVADVVISMPKIKTHQKAGITAALKNLVGINGDKDFLPHHRLGGTGFGGDCYPGKNILRFTSELIRDAANRRMGKWLYRPMFKVSTLLWKLSFPAKVHHLGAGWHGNDTTWRMVFDLNKIAEYGTLDGEISKNKQRVLFSLSDGIIGGQGDGPLKPDPLALGVITFTNHSAMHDVCMGKLMGFDIKRIPLLEYAYQLAQKGRVDIYLNSVETKFNMLDELSVETTPPPGWIDHLKNIK